MPPIQRDQLSVERWMTTIRRILNSNQAFLLDESFELSVQHTDIPTGSCRKNVSKLLRQILDKKRCITQIRNTDCLCMARAIVVAKAHADGDKTMYTKLYRTKKLQTEKTKELLQAAELPDREFSVEDIPRFEIVLPNYQFIVVSVDHGNSIVYCGAYCEKRIMLLHHDHHFDVLTSLPAYFEQQYYCYRCMKGYNKRQNHRCEFKCHQCLSVTCPMDKLQNIHCPDCNRDFHGQECFYTHKSGSSPICAKFFICELCKSFVSMVNRRMKTNYDLPQNYPLYDDGDKDSDNENDDIELDIDDQQHRCGEVFCPTCSLFFMPEDNHVCYMQPIELTDKEKAKHLNDKLAYFDLETFQDEAGDFKVNLAVIATKDEKFVLPEDGNISGDISSALGEFIFSERFRGYTFIAHNLKGFDGYFLLNYLIKNGIIPHPLIFNGSKVVQMDISKLKIKFRDSMNYVPSSLKNFAKAFGLQETKGDFPHKLNQPENWNKILPWPDRHDYGYQLMKRKSVNVL
ncbi:uncharacterized protein LOC129582497 [Paramacrobiotus metropolitanus]|uniref:uncharacterized protein LOC129582497 n=1 Tax=Paramacrobiotus metropolitanus TaxID=2943436 RepID=UPI002445BFD7|nr:uncharacterized protein LOC129582497 [Paramacrobiotus metropolitanus]